ncbi:hypothetical protein Xentx_01456 [Xenorhabdus thuongxuanensis]|uniref:Uncharacterized protein n=1 Tax=Xenorhabdus thuongxuanensis TaxID=1873484 RepID=A0A1Q5U404_9GAMM|nr:hypothetical protein Xentx_01456 [Xenorhabdus thuongxuanensis]
MSPFCVAIPSPLCIFHAISESKKATIKVAFSNPNSLFYSKLLFGARAGLVINYNLLILLYLFLRIVFMPLLMPQKILLSEFAYLTDFI